MKKTIKILLYIAGIFLIVAVGLIAWFVSVTKDALLDENKMTETTQNINVFYSDGSPLKSDEGYVKLYETPEHLQKAFIAVEDKRFYSHKGVDIKSVLRAIKNDVTSLSAKEGASTITQQLVKNLYLTNEKTVERKFKEIKLALILESKYSKEQILEKYLNTVYFGEGAYGVKKAARIYFDKKPEELSEEQSALLAGIVKAPSFYDPFINPEEAKKRRNVVLNEMAKENYISQSRVKQLKNKDIILNFNKNTSCDEILNNAAISDAASLIGKSEKNLKGLNIYLSIDKKTSDELPAPDEYGINTDFSSIIIDNKNFSVTAFKSSVGEIKRSPASTVKPWLIYAPAIEEKIITAATKIKDEPTDFNGYKPRNNSDEYFGFTNARDCLCKSLNVPSVKLLNSLGIERAISYAEKMNITIKNSDASIALGNLSGGMTLREIASAYLPFSNRGNYSLASIIDKITDQNGKTLYLKSTKTKRIFSEATAYIINDALKLTSKTGTTKKLNSLDFEVCSKTGTNGNADGNQDAYCVAYTPEYTVAVWLGNKNGEKMPNEISGGSYPTVLVADALSDIYKDFKPGEFNQPDSVVKVKINNNEYEKSGRIYLSNGDKTDPCFYFTKGTQPQKKFSERLPEIYDFKINYEKPYVLVTVEKDGNTEFEIRNAFDDIVYDSFTGAEAKLLAKDNYIYKFYILPYKFNGKNKIYGSRVPLPSVNTCKNLKNPLYYR